MGRNQAKPPGPGVAWPVSEFRIPNFEFQSVSVQRLRRVVATRADRYEQRRGARVAESLKPKANVISMSQHLTNSASNSPPEPPNPYQNPIHFQSTPLPTLQPAHRRTKDTDAPAYAHRRRRASTNTMAYQCQAVGVNETAIERGAKNSKTAHNSRVCECARQSACFDHFGKTKCSVCMCVCVCACVRALMAIKNG